MGGIATSQIVVGNGRERGSIELRLIKSHLHGGRKIRAIGRIVLNHVKRARNC